MTGPASTSSTSGMGRDPAEPISAHTRAYATRIGISLVLLIASAVLNYRTVTRALRIETSTAKAAVLPFADAADRLARQRDAVGTFVTGNDPGDRAIVVQSDGHVRFYVVGPLQGSLESNDTYDVGQRDGKPCVVTHHSGVIEMTDIDTVSYFGDTYYRDGGNGRKAPSNDHRMGRSVEG